MDEVLSELARVRLLAPDLEDRERASSTLCAHVSAPAKQPRSLSPTPRHDQNETNGAANADRLLHRPTCRGRGRGQVALGGGALATIDAACPSAKPVENALLAPNAASAGTFSSEPLSMIPCHEDPVPGSGDILNACHVAFDLDAAQPVLGRAPASAA